MTLHRKPSADQRELLKTVRACLRETWPGVAKRTRIPLETLRNYLRVEDAKGARSMPPVVSAYLEEILAHENLKQNMDRSVGRVHGARK